MSGTTEVLRLFVIVLAVGNVLALAAGLALLLAPKRIAKWLGLRSAHPLSIRLLTKPFEKPRNSERVMLRYPRVLGAVLLAGGAFVMFKWTFFVSSLSVADGARMLHRLFPASTFSAPAWESFWVTALVLILLGAVLALLVGALALVRVQTLKNLSSFTNRWISTRRAVKPVSRPYYGIDRLVGQRPQVWGGIITLLAVYTLVMILWSARGLA
jgi:hypothetical protein